MKNTNKAKSTKRLGRNGYGECHKCRYNLIAQNLDTASEADIEAAREACTSCKGPAEDSGKGLWIIHTGGMPTPHECIGGQIDKSYLASKSQARSETVTRLDAGAEKAVRELLDLFRRLNLRQVQCLHELLNGHTTPSAGRELGISKQAVSKHLHSAAAKFPAIADFLADTFSPEGRDSRKTEGKRAGIRLK